MRTLAIDAEDFEMAFQSSVPEAEYFLNVETGEVIFRPHDTSAFPDDDDVHKIAEDQTGRLLFIQPMFSSDGYRLMERFIGSRVEDESAINRLSSALSGKSPFRRFKDALDWFPGLKERWFQYQSEELMKEGAAWLAGKGIQVNWQKRNPR